MIRSAASIDPRIVGFCRMRIVAPWWVAGVLPVRTLAQRVVEVAARGNIDEALRIAREEQVGLTTPQPAPRDRSEPEPEPEPEVLA